MADAIGARSQVCVFGRLRVLLPDGTEIAPQGHPVRQLLLFLAMHGGTVHTDHAIETLWPDASLSSARANLRNTLARLRAQCGPIVAREGDSLRLHADTDLDAYEQAATLLMRLSGQTLAPDAYYAEWAEDTRRRLGILRDAFLQGERVAGRWAGRPG